MSTKIKNTLFRFVTMRAPEFLEKEMAEQRFVSHPESSKEPIEIFDSIFLQAANHITEGNSKRKSLNDAATTFSSNALKTREALYENQLISKDLYDFAVWLTKNRTKITPEEIQQKTTVFSSEEGLAGWIPKFEPLSNTILTQLWDNLFYQIITYKSSYVREAILSVLVADFFLKNQVNTEQNNASLRKQAQARVIIPKTLVEKEDTSIQKVALQQAIDALPINTKNLDKQLELQLVQEQIVSYQKTINELKKAQSIYNKENQKALKLAQKTYDTTVANLYTNAETVEVTITDPVTNQQTTRTEFVNLVIPPFEFEKEPELQPTLLTGKTSQNTTSMVDQLVNSYEFETFEEIIEHLNTTVDQATKYLLENTVVSETLISSNGIILPEANLTSNQTFSVAASSTSGTSVLSFLFSDSVNQSDIIAASYTITFEDNTTFTDTTFIDSIINEKLYVKTFLNNLSFIGKTSFTISGTFTKNDGSKIEFSGLGLVEENILGLQKIITGEGDVIVYDLKGNGSYELKSILDSNNGDTGTENSASTNDGAVIDYIPSGFGIKRLGIADYRKVEQEVCCYVPGEVSHIENVMAREYKEKATRRLRRSEDTFTSSNETETERLTDTTSTDRFEMNQEVASVMTKDTSFGAHVNANYHGDHYSLDAGADFSTNTSSEQSNNQAITHAKEVTEKVLDRVVQKVKEERVSKVIEEFEENNKHGFDNTQGDKHVSGVYRWIDKIYRNQILNYGKRLMYEFMIPQPATFHNLATSIKKNEFDFDKIEKPVDPRTAEIPLKTDASFDSRYKFWVEKYNVEVDKKPKEQIAVGKSFSILGHPIGSKLGYTESNSGTGEVKIPEGYETLSTESIFNASSDGDLQGNILSLSVGNAKNTYSGKFLSYSLPLDGAIGKYVNEVPVSFTLGNHVSGDINVNIICQLTQEAKDQWRLETFNAIIKAYEEKLAEYNAKISNLKALQSEKIRVNPMFFRQIENTVLRKNCIEYLVSHEALGKTSLLLGGTVVANTQVDYQNPALETYAAKVKFFEQAFEWNLMSYNLYPFYWANKSDWGNLYNTTEVDDPTFRAFLQSGMARVIVTIRPGFEEAVNWYMATGQIWNGGQVPTIDDPLYISIVDELRETTGAVEETWETRVPTSLTVIQAGSIGLDVQGLPCDDDCADNKLFDSDGNPVLDGNGKQISINPIIQSIDANGNDVVLGKSIVYPDPIGGGGPGGGEVPPAES